VAKSLFDSAPGLCHGRSFLAPYSSAPGPLGPTAPEDAAR
jgi:hypothetical protein